jgi:hypothetical protein
MTEEAFSISDAVLCISANGNNGIGKYQTSNAVTAEELKQVDLQHE